MKGLRELVSVLRHRDYRYVWLAHSCSVTGDAIVVVAVSLLVIKLTGDATDLGVVFAAWALALVSFLLLGGVWADRLPRHRVMVAADVVRFALHAALAALILTGEVRIWHLVVIEGLFGAAEAFFQPASTGLLPQTVPEAEIQEAVDEALNLSKEEKAQLNELNQSSLKVFVEAQKKARDVLTDEQREQLKPKPKDKPATDK